MHGNYRLKPEIGHLPARKLANRGSGTPPPATTILVIKDNSTIFYRDYPNININVSNINVNVPYPSINVPHPNIDYPKANINVSHPNVNVSYLNVNVPHLNINVPYPSINVPYPSINYCHINMNVPHLNVSNTDLGVHTTHISDNKNALRRNSCNIVPEMNNDRTYTGNVDAKTSYIQPPTNTTKYKYKLTLLI